MLRTRIKSTRELYSGRTVWLVESRENRSTNIYKCRVITPPQHVPSRLVTPVERFHPVVQRMFYVVEVPSVMLEVDGAKKTVPLHSVGIGVSLSNATLGYSNFLFKNLRDADRALRTLKHDIDVRSKYQQRFSDYMAMLDEGDWDEE